jgi:DNA-binding HxlR family transcriptional regulator
MNLDDHQVLSALDAVRGKWKPLIIHRLTGGPRRFGELRRLVGGVTQKVLTQQLRELERDNLLARSASTSPLRVDYRLTERGRSLSHILEQMTLWAGRSPGTPDSARTG